MLLVISHDSQRQMRASYAQASLGKCERRVIDNNSEIIFQETD